MRKCFLAGVLFLCTSVACLPSSARSLNRAAVLYKAGQFREAAAEYQRAISSDPSWSPPYLGLGNALLELGDRAGANSAYRRAVALSPNYAEAQIALAQLLMNAQQWHDSEEQLKAALKELPEDGRLYAMLGVTLAKERRHRDALEAFDRSGQLCPQCMTNDEVAIYNTLKNLPNPNPRR